MIAKYIASCSFGKDSLAAIITRIEHGKSVDGAIYCRIMFDNKISAEYPEHEEWIHDHAIPLLESRYGINTTVIQAQTNYTEQFYRVVQKKTKNYGKIWGFPFINAAWCNSGLKMRPIRDWKSQAEEHTEIVGIAADEPNRARKATVKGKILPLVEYGIVEADTFGICRDATLLSPAYKNGRERLGCWFCHNQRIGELRQLRREYPELWNKLMRLDKDSPVSFKPPPKRGSPGVTLHDMEERFSNEEAQMTLY